MIPENHDAHRRPFNAFSMKPGPEHSTGDIAALGIAAAMPKKLAFNETKTIR
jgi:hypothetical protein